MSLIGEWVPSAGFFFWVDLVFRVEYLLDLTASIIEPLMMADTLFPSGLFKVLPFFGCSTFLVIGDTVLSFLEVAKIFLASFFAISFFRLSSFFCYFSCINRFWSSSVILSICGAIVAEGAILGDFSCKLCVDSGIVFRVCA